jgi:hypothetical protein
MSAFTSRYTIPTAIATAFTPAEAQELKENFGLFDANNDGSIDARELTNILQRIGEAVSAGDVQRYLAEADVDNDQKVSFEEFANYVHSIRTGGAAGGKRALGSIIKKASGMLKVEGAGGASHTFSEEEKV